MAQFFDSKAFNPAVFGQYVDSVENTHLLALIKSGAVVENGDIKDLFGTQTGGFYAETPIFGNIYDAVADNYDGTTDINASTTNSYVQGKIAGGRAHAFKEKDFTTELTSTDPMRFIGDQVAEWIDMNRQKSILAQLEGIFKVGGFTDKHTYDATGVTNSDGQTGIPDATTFNTGMQKACGDRKKKFSLAFMDSATATVLENKNILSYLKYTDENGMQRDTDLATVNGKLVIVDDDAPTFQKKTADAVAGVYTITVSTALTSGDSVEIAGVEYEYSSGATTKNAQATAIAAAINADTTANKLYTAEASSDTVTFTEKEGKEGTGAPEVDQTGSTTGVLTSATTTAGKAAVYRTAHITYVLGNGAIEHTDVGVKVPFEMYRDPKSNGGETLLYVRHRDVFAPAGFSFTKASLAKLSPTDAEYATGANWSVVADGSGNKIDDKLIPIARIITFD